MNPVELTKSLVAIKSNFDEFPYEIPIGEFIENYFRQHGFSTQLQFVPTSETDNTPDYTRFNVLAEKGDGDKSLLLYGHMDTVPRVEGWTTNPWEPIEKVKTLNDGKEISCIYGLGSHDMKAGLAAIMSAAAAIEPQGYKLKLAILVDEENMSRGAFKLISSDWIDDVALALVPESGTSEHQLLGPKMLTLGRRGRITIQVDVFGVSAHAANPANGSSAIVRAAQLILGLQKAVDTKKIASLVHPDEPNQTGSFSIRTFNADAISLSIPDKASFLIDRHLVPGETVELALEEIHQVIRELYEEGNLSRFHRNQEMAINVFLKQRGNPYLMPYVTPSTHPYVEKIAAIIQKQFQIESVFYNYGLSVADENYFGASRMLGGRELPVIVLGAAGDGNHAADEWVSVQSIEELTEIYRQIIRNFGNW